MRRASFTLILFSFFALTLQAQAAHDIIETHVDMGFLGLFSDMEYHLNGQKLQTYEDFKKTIYPLQDPEASKLIHEAEETDFVSYMLLATGTAVSLDIALVYPPVQVFHNDLEDRGMTFFFTVQIGLGVFQLVHSAADSRKFNAVQRYNHVIWHKEHNTSAMSLDPCLYACKDGLVLGEKLSF